MSPYHCLPRLRLATPWSLPLRGPRWCLRRRRHRLSLPLHSCPPAKTRPLVFLLRLLRALDSHIQRRSIIYIYKHPSQTLCDRSSNAHVPALEAPRSVAPSRWPGPGPGHSPAARRVPPPSCPLPRRARWTHLISCCGTHAPRSRTQLIRARLLAHRSLPSVTRAKPGGECGSTSLAEVERGARFAAN